MGKLKLKPNEQRVMVTKQIADFLIIAAVILASCSLLGCASNRARNTESLLAAAGFHTLTPQTPQQQVCYNALPPYKLVRTETNGKIAYAYADKKRGIVYLGGEKQKQEFRRLTREQENTNEPLEAAAMNETQTGDWAFWGPPGVWW
jgi:hypothetical protein